MMQITLTLIIVFSAGIIALARVIGFFRSPFGKCTGCSQNEKGCFLEDLKKEMDMKNSKKQIPEIRSL